MFIYLDFSVILHLQPSKNRKNETVGVRKSLLCWLVYKEENIVNKPTKKSCIQNLT